ncbi:iron-responsive element-binding protein 2 isoform X2 [Spea bombifrons]|uniref:iron-responsive element-binding protein 2 isoform X2 n=1 Tax=Spea bombifrons TaxID=233779 RepID=UPI0023495214|nr:iron-responsive element-binding protein 2 isoform X2 [Spea bombifrons]
MATAGDEETGASPARLACETEDPTDKPRIRHTSMAENPFQYLLEPLPGSSDKMFFNVSKLQAAEYDSLPYCMRVVLEAVVRNCDGVLIKPQDAMNILNWKTKCESREVPFLPGRVLLQDFTGIPAMVDFAAMRDAVKKLGRDYKQVNPVCPTNLIVDHSLLLDVTKCTAQSVPTASPIETSKPATKLSPAKMPGRKPHCRSPNGCKGACDSGSSSKNSKEQIENTPMLCPFHLQPIPEPEAALKSLEMEFNRNKERLQFFKWCSKAFQNVTVIPPETGTVHQVNLEYLSRVVMEEKGLLYPDSVLGTDSHTTMVNGLGILGLGVGGIESEAAMLGMPVTLTLPDVIGCKLTGTASPFATSIDVVLSITKHLRQSGVAGKFVEFFGEGISQLSVADRTTIANMCPEYGATVAFFPVDTVTLCHLKQTGFDPQNLKIFEGYLKAVKLLRHEDTSKYPEYSKVLEINLHSIVPYVSGPKKPQDRVSVADMKKDFGNCLNEKAVLRGFQIPVEKQNLVVPVTFGGSEYCLGHGCVLIAAVISCTNNCNPSVMLTAGLLAKKAVEAGLTVKPYIKTSLSPGSGTVTHYLTASGVLPYLSQLGFDIIGYGCSRCVGNTNPLPEEIVTAIKEGELVACGVYSGSKHFEGLRCSCVRANYLASPPLVVAYALAGTVNTDLQTEALGINAKGEQVFLRDIWPSREEVLQVEENLVIPSMFKELKVKIEKQSTRWNLLDAPESPLFPWDLRSTYIRSPPFFYKLDKFPSPQQPIEKAHVLLYLGDSVTTDHVSPAGSIPRTSPAAKYLIQKNLAPREFNSYGARRGNDAVMTRGTFANMKLFNKLIGKMGPKTIHFPSGQTMDVFDAAELYQKADIPLIIIAGKKYGSGSSRDWAAKGPYLLGVKAIIAESYEKIHKDHLVGMGIVPLQFFPGENAESLNLSGKEQYSISIPVELSPKDTLEVKTNSGKVFRVIAAFDKEVEVTFYQHGGILNYVARKYL